jgi:hypothetical protein
MTSQHPVPSRKPHMLSLLALIALAGAGCGDDTATAPEAVQASVTAGTSAKDPRTPYISDLQLHFPVVDMGPDGTYDNGYDIAVMNPARRPTASTNRPSCNRISTGQRAEAPPSSARP